MRFLDVKTDYAFKKVFGSAESKPILISFLNALIAFPKGREVTDLTIVDPYQIPMLQGMKETYVDVKAKLADGREVIIEWLYFVQNAGHLQMVPKALDEAPIREAFAIANTAALMLEELEQQERRHDFIRLQRGAQEKAFDEGQALGLAKGRAGGEQAKAIAVARNLLTILDDAAIAAATGLSEDRVASLRTEAG